MRDHSSLMSTCDVTNKKAVSELLKNCSTAKKHFDPVYDKEYKERDWHKNSAPSFYKVFFHLLLHSIKLNANYM